MSFKNLLYDIRESILYLTLNRPDTHNSLSPAMWDELYQAIQAAQADASVRVIILTGAGTKAFASGANIEELHTRNYLKMLQSTASKVLAEFEDFTKPIICAINGYALGGGCELALACDIRIATERSRFGLPELSLGIIPGAGGTQRLARLVGIGKAKELIFTGRILDAQEAQHIGLINMTTANDPALLLQEAEVMAKQMIAKAPWALELAKLSINQGMATQFQTGLLIERLAETIAFSTQDRLEGTLAFLEKRPPDFSGK